MKFLSWNCRGLANISTIRSLRAIIRLNNPDAIFLSETKTAATITTSIMLQLGFTHLVQAPPLSLEVVFCLPGNMVLTLQASLFLLILFVLRVYLLIVM
jgi:hypothetical protein